MAACDAQTSGGLLIAVNSDYAEAALKDLRSNKYPYAEIIGDAIPQTSLSIFVD